jgi:hypothetical protein
MFNVGVGGFDTFNDSFDDEVGDEPNSARWVGAWETDTTMTQNNSNNKRARNTNENGDDDGNTSSSSQRRKQMKSESGGSAPAASGSMAGAAVWREAADDNDDDGSDVHLFRGECHDWLPHSFSSVDPPPLSSLGRSESDELGGSVSSTTGSAESCENYYDYDDDASSEGYCGGGDSPGDLFEDGPSSLSASSSSSSNIGQQLLQQKLSLPSSPFPFDQFLSIGRGGAGGQGGGAVRASSASLGLDALMTFGTSSSSSSQPTLFTSNSLNTEASALSRVLPSLDLSQFPPTSTATATATVGMAAANGRQGGSSDELASTPAHTKMPSTPQLSVLSEGLQLPMEGLGPFDSEACRSGVTIW